MTTNIDQKIARGVSRQQNALKFVCVDSGLILSNHDDVIKWKHFPRYCLFVRWIHRSPVNSSHKGQWRGALMLPLICVWTNAWVNNRDAGDLRRYRVHYDVTVMPVNCRHTCSITFDVILAIMGRNGGLWPVECQAIIWTNAVLLLIRHVITNLDEILIINLKITSGKGQPIWFRIRRVL